MTSLVQLSDDLLYPASDGNPMADSTIQYRWIVTIKENVDLLFKDDPLVFVAGDLLWYPIPVKDGIDGKAPSQAPDVMVVFGVAKGDRRSYLQFRENNIAPQVVFEILSDSNKTKEGREKMQEKFEFYQHYGVEEYYLYDPNDWVLQGWHRQGRMLTPITDMGDWVSPRLGIRFVWNPNQELILHYPNGQRFLSFLELSERAELAEERAELAEERAELAEERAELAEERAEQERFQKELALQQALAEEQRAEQERQRAEQLANYLRALGIDPDTIPGS